MSFQEIYKYFVAGTPIKRKGWGGFWRYDTVGIRIYLEDGEFFPFKESDNMISTLSHTVIDDWEIATKENCSAEAGMYI